MNKNIKHRGTKGFSLMELLMVLAIMAFMASVSTPAWNFLTQSQGISAGAQEMASMIEFARKEAITRQTYVWIGFETVQSGTGRSILAAAVYSQDGSGTNTQAGNLIPLGKPLMISNACLASRSELAENLQQKLSGSAGTPLENTVGIHFERSGRQFSGNTMTITPGGELLLKGQAGPYDGYELEIELGVSQSKGDSIPANARQVALVIDGAQGSVHIVQAE